MINLPKFDTKSDLETIEEKFSAEQTPKNNLFASEISVDDKFDMLSLNNSCMDQRGGQSNNMFNSVMDPLRPQFELNSKTKVSVIVDWISKDVHYSNLKNKEMDASLLETNKNIQNKLMFNFSSNVRANWMWKHSSLRKPNSKQMYNKTNDLKNIINKTYRRNILIRFNANH